MFDIRYDAINRLQSGGGGGGGYLKDVVVVVVIVGGGVGEVDAALDLIDAVVSTAAVDDDTEDFLRCVSWSSL